MLWPMHVHFSDDRTLQLALRTRVDRWFAETGRSRHADWRMKLKAAVYLGATAGLFALLTSGVLPAWVALGVCVMLGLALAGVGFNVGHDAIHGSFSARPWVNRLFSATFDIIGASSANWSHAHNVVHHSFTNVPGVDKDLEPGPWLRFHPQAARHRLHRFQHVYSFALYCLTSLMWVLKKDVQQVLQRDENRRRPPLGKVVRVFAWKAFHFALFLGVPMLLSGYAWWMVLLGYVTMHFCIGLTLAIVFQLAHVVEQTAFPSPDDSHRIAHSWSAHQLLTTANFASQSRVCNFLFGGLNQQVEHHLFAKVCHIHYPDLSRLVREVAKEHGLPYHDNPTLWSALVSHVRTLRALGNPLPA